jgi:hypothetical protein
MDLFIIHLLNSDKKAANTKALQWRGIPPRRRAFVPIEKLSIGTIAYSDQPLLVVLCWSDALSIIIAQGSPLGNYSIVTKYVSTIKTSYDDNLIKHQDIV